MTTVDSLIVEGGAGRFSCQSAHSIMCKLLKMALADLFVKIEVHICTKLLLLFQYF